MYDEDEDDDAVETIEIPEIKTYEDALEACEIVADEVGGSVYEDYSGRFMFGAQCPGVTCGNANEAIEAAARVGLKGARTDNMGLDMIVYWPRYTKRDAS
jgi:hypothetical protein